MYFTSFINLTPNQDIVCFFIPTRYAYKCNINLFIIVSPILNSHVSERFFLTLLMDKILMVIFPQLLLHFFIIRSNAYIVYNKRLKNHASLKGYTITKKNVVLFF